MEYRNEKSGTRAAEPAEDAAGLFMPQNAFRITVDGFADHDFHGRIWYPRQDIELPFHDTTQFLIRTEELLDRWTAPRLTGPLRVFNKRKGKRKMDTTMQQLPPSQSRHPGKPTGERGTFLVKILFRQNNSWQGEVIWAETNERRRFRSALELIKLIDSAVGSGTDDTDDGGDADDRGVTDVADITGNTD